MEKLLLRGRLVLDVLQYKRKVCSLYAFTLIYVIILGEYTRCRWSM